MSDAPRWPIPGESPLRIAQTMARAYRTALAGEDPLTAAALDARMVAFGQSWIVEPEQIYDPYDAITTTEAAKLVCVGTTTIRQWAITPHPYKPGSVLLPKFGDRGKQSTYLVIHVGEAATLAHSVRLVRRATVTPLDSVTVTA
jgi:hypothetical protein